MSSKSGGKENMRKIWILCGYILFTSLLVNSTLRSQVTQLQPAFERTYTPLEMVISRRMSIQYGEFYDLTTPVPSELVSQVLWAAYGYSWRGRAAPTLSGHPIIVYVCDETAAYQFVPENQSLTLLKEGDYRGLGGAYPAPIQLFIAVDTNICENVTWGNAEAGCPVQNIYLMANALNLGTVVTDDVYGDINGALGLPANVKFLYKMSLGYPLPPFRDYQNLVPTSRPSSSELPEIQDSAMSLEDALDALFSSHEWSEDLITKQELSQVLWASYGQSYYEDTVSSPKRHRTVPSAHAYYPMRIYAANSSGIYEYIPEQHTLTTIVAEDRRLSIALASGNTWASSAPLIIALVWDDSHILTVDTTYVEVGLITQNVHLESAAWGLIADWARADSDEEAMRAALGLTGENHLHPASVITIAHPSLATIREDTNVNFKVDIYDLFIVSKAYQTTPHDTGWDPRADIYKDFKITIRDIFSIAKKFGWRASKI